MAALVMAALVRTALVRTALVRTTTAAAALVTALDRPGAPGGSYPLAVPVVAPVIGVTLPGPSLVGRLVAAGTAVLSSNVVVEVILVIRTQVAHARQDDDHNKGDHGCQNDQHGLRHRTIHHGV